MNTPTGASILDLLGEPEGMLEHALLYGSLGWTIFPLLPMVNGVCICKDGKECKSAGKHPMVLWGPKTEEGRGASSDEEVIRGWFRRRGAQIGGLGVATGWRSGVLVIDLDEDKGGFDSWKKLVEEHDPPPTLEVTTGSGGTHYYYQMPPDVDLRPSAGDLAPGVDVRANGGYAVLPPSAHKSGGVYTWELLGADVIAVPPPSLVEAIKNSTKTGEKARERRDEKDALIFQDEQHARAYLRKALMAECARVANAKSGEERRGRIGVLFGATARMAALASGIGVPALAVQQALEGAAKRCGLIEEIEDFDRHFRNAWIEGTSDPRAVVIQRIGLRLAETGEDENDGVEEEDAPEHSRMGEEEPAERLFTFTDYGNAERFVDQHGRNARYCAQLGGWRIWDGVTWWRDRTGKITRMAKATARSLREERRELEQEQKRLAAEDPGDDDAAIQAQAEKAQITKKMIEGITKHIKSTESRRGLDAMLSLSESEIPIPAVVEQFDADPYLFGVGNGVLELRKDGSYHFRAARRSDYLTQQSDVEFDEYAECPRFDQFMLEIMEGDAELVQFLQRFAGYSMTGLNIEQKFLFLHGGGANGKSTLINILRAIFGSYAKMLRPEVLMAQGGSSTGPTPDLARLRGARLVTSVETEEGTRMAESMVKQLTGGDTIVAEHKYQEPFEFTPQFKMWFAANHEPKISNQDHAIWRRVLKVPFHYQVPEDKANKYLGDEILADEAPGVLSWVVEGFCSWQRTGLRPPEKVLAATRKYREDADFLGPFLAACCTLEHDAECNAADLWKAWERWAKENGEKPRSQTWLGRMLTSRGYESRKGPKGVRLRVGLRVNDVPNQVGMDMPGRTDRWN